MLITVPLGLEGGPPHEHVPHFQWRGVVVVACYLEIATWTSSEKPQTLHVWKGL